MFKFLIPENHHFMGLTAEKLGQLARSGTDAKLPHFSIAITIPWRP